MIEQPVVALLSYELGLLVRRRIKHSFERIAAEYGCLVTFHDDGGLLSAKGAARIHGENALAAATAIRNTLAELAK